VKLHVKELAMPLTSLVNNAFKTNVFPADMKKAEVSPVFKKKDHMNKENYRPINLIPIFSKVFESIIAEQINDFMYEKFSKRLGAYRKGHGCSQVLTWAVDTWKWCLDNDMHVGALLMDLSKAFDSIPHDLLICKMYAYGFSLNACSFMLSYLSHRMQRVKIKDTRSVWKNTKRGIPQGSCLGPLLFNLFVNDIFSHVECCELFNYADDNTLSASDFDMDRVLQMLQHDANIVMNWFHDNFMKVNPEKFQLLLMHSQSSPEYMVNEFIVEQNVIEIKESVTLLGINIDSKLNFNDHVKTLCKKATRQLKVMYRFKDLLGKREKFVMYKSFILSTFNFCPVVWSFCGITSIRKIEKVQERALRFLTNDQNSSYKEMLSRINGSTMLVTRLREIVIEVFKCVNRLNPEFLNQLFNVKENKYLLRDPCILAVPKFKRVKYGKQSISYYGAHLWNNLPSMYKENMDLCTFRNMIKTWEGPECTCNMCSVNFNL